MSVQISPTAYCPFCRSDSVRIETGEVRCYVKCFKCQAQGPVGHNEEEAWWLWNKLLEGDVQDNTKDQTPPSLFQLARDYCYQQAESALRGARLSDKRKEYDPAEHFFSDAALWLERAKIFNRELEQKK